MTPHGLIRLAHHETQKADPRVGFYARERGRTIGESTDKSSDFKKGAATSAAIDPELAELSGRWENLAAVIKSAVLAIARQDPANGR